jgi:NAD(P)-dependent dehydrogenase (short-subunit alcohol dehydrogenase family)
MSAYVTSKAALIRFTEVLAAELRPHGVAAFAIEPGTVRTAMAEQLLGSETGRRWLPWFQEIFENRRDVSAGPAERLVLHLASGECDALSGHFLSVPGAGEPEQTVATDLGVLRIGSDSDPMGVGAHTSTTIFR